MYASTAAHLEVVLPQVLHQRAWMLVTLFVLI